MRKRPPVASLDEVTIRRDGDDAIIAFRDSTIATTHFRIGPSVRHMTDKQILDRFNKIVAAEQRAATARRHIAVESPPGRPQIRYFAAGDQWAPRGGVLRCVVDDSGPGGEAIIHIDEQPLSLIEFGRLLCTYAGWACASPSCRKKSARPLGPSRCASSKSSTGLRAGGRAPRAEAGGDACPPPRGVGRPVLARAAVVLHLRNAEDAMTIQAAAGERVHYHACPLCEACCGLEVRTADGRSSASAATRTTSSARVHLPQGLRDEGPARRPRPPAHAADQARRPRRARTWDEAFAEIERRLLPFLHTHGRDAVGRDRRQPDRRTSCGSACSTRRPAQALGIEERVLGEHRSTRCPSSCRSGLMFGTADRIAGARHRAHRLPAGARRQPGGSQRQPVDGARLPRQGCARCAAARRQVWSIDPRRIAHARAIADAHHFIRPGADAHFLLAPWCTRCSPSAAAPRTAGAAHRRRGRSSRRWRALYTPEVRGARCRASTPTTSASSPASWPRPPRGRGLRPHRHLHPGVRHAVRLGWSTWSTS